MVGEIIEETVFWARDFDEKQYLTLNMAPKLSIKIVIVFLTVRLK
jgi:hypothetical protein